MHSSKFERDVIKELKAINRELKAFNRELSKNKQITLDSETLVGSIASELNAQKDIADRWI